MANKKGRQITPLIITHVKSTKTTKVQKRNKSPASSINTKKQNRVKTEKPKRYKKV